MSDSLLPLFEPRSIAVIGASATPGKYGHTVVRNLLRCGFAGSIYPVHPARMSVEGLSGYGAVREIPERVDCAMLVIPADKVVEAVSGCAEAGVRSVVIGASGFAETGTPQGIAAQRELARIATQSGMRMLGPNTNGLLNTSNKLSLGYNAEHAQPGIAGSISIVSHSGALFGGALGTLRRLGIGLSKFVPVGNEADITMLEVLNYLLEDKDTSVIGLIMEGISNGSELRRIASQAKQAGKPIVAMKVGRSALGRQATLAHSSRLAGSARAYDALLEECGIAIARSVETLAVGCAVLLERRTDAHKVDQRLVCISTSGAGGALLADFAAERNIALVGDSTGEWEGRAAEVAAKIPASGRIRHPLDSGSLRGDWTRMNDILLALEEDGSHGPTVVYTHVAPNHDRNLSLVEILSARKSRTGTPVVVVAPGGLGAELEAAYRTAKIPLLLDLNSCFEGLACYYASLEPGAEFEESFGSVEQADLPVSLVDHAKNGSFLSELESAAIIRAAGIPMVESQVVSNSSDLRQAAARFKYPLVMKAIPPSLAHKSDSGFVLTSLHDEEAVIKAFRKLGDNMVAQGFSDADTPRIVQPMVASNMELILGITFEKGLGHFALIGLGGIHADVLNEVVLIPLPSSRSRVLRRMGRSRLGALLRRIKIMEQLADLVQSLQHLVLRYEQGIESIDLNPVLVTPSGCIAVDALIVPKREIASST